MRITESEMAMEKLKSYKFCNHDWKYGQTIGWFMPGEFFVPLEDIKMALSNALMHIDGIDWTQKVAASAFFDKEDWEGFVFGKRLALGRCIKFFCDEGLLPIKVTNPGKKGRRYYERSGSH